MKLILVDSDTLISYYIFYLYYSNSSFYSIYKPLDKFVMKRIEEDLYFINKYTVK